MPVYAPSPPTPVLQQLGMVVASVGAGSGWFDAVGTRTASGGGTATARPALVVVPADWAGFSVANLEVSLVSTAAQTGVTFTFGVYPAGISGTTTTIVSFGTVITGSTAAIVAPGAAAHVAATSGNFALGLLGINTTYMIGLAHNATTAAASLTQFTAVLRFA